VIKTVLDVAFRSPGGGEPFATRARYNM